MHRDACGGSDEDHAALDSRAATFNAAKAECFKQEDRQKLLAVIEAGFGNFDEFNTGVREIFKLRRMSVAAASGLQHASVTLAAADSSLEMASA